MKKKKLQTIGTLLLSCCLLATSPISSPGIISSYAAGSVASYQLDITPPATLPTVDLDDYITLKIQDALLHHNVVTVVGTAELNNSNCDNPIIIDIPNGKKVIWMASVHNSTTYNYNPTLLLRSNDRVDFVIAGGTLSSVERPLVSTDAFSYLNLIITGGNIYLSDQSADNAISLSGYGDFRMSGGTVISHSSEPAIRVSPPPTDPYDFEITGGVLYRQGSKNGTNVIDDGTGNPDNNVIQIDHVGAIPNVHIDASRANIITWDENSYNADGVPIYVTGGYDKRHILTYPGSATKVSWTTGSDGNAAISYETASGETGMIEGINAGSDDVNFPAIPTNVVYDNTPKGVENFTHAFSPINFEYTGVNGTNYPTSPTKPVNAGEYKITTTLPSAFQHYPVELGILKIAKRPVTIQVADQTIHKDAALPALPQSFADFTVQNLVAGDTAQDALAALPTFTWNTDGHTPGTFAVTTTAPIAYTDNYEAATNAITGTLTVLSTTAPAATTPGTPAGTTPGTPAVTTPGTPATPAPGTPAVTTPGTPAGTTPGTPATPALGTPAVTAPGATAVTTPGAPAGTGAGIATPSTATPSTAGVSGRSNSSRSGGSVSYIGRAAKSSGSHMSGVWILDSKGWWFKYSDGSYPKYTWARLMYNNKIDWYYFDAEGYMKEGWQMINDKWYFLYERTEGSVIHGAMAYDTTIDGYRVDSKGAWIQ